MGRDEPPQSQGSQVCRRLAKWCSESAPRHQIGPFTHSSQSLYTVVTRQISGTTLHTPFTVKDV